MHTYVHTLMLHAYIPEYTAVLEDKVLSIRSMNVNKIVNRFQATASFIAQGWERWALSCLI